MVGIATGDQGIGRDGKPKESFVRGMELRGKQTLLAEGARGSLSQSAMATYNLRAVNEHRASTCLMDGDDDVFVVLRCNHI